MKYKLLDRNLIRHFGKVIIDLDAGMGDRYAKAGKAKLVGSADKMTYGPPLNKAVFQAPEDKNIAELGESIRYPGPDDKLFPHIEK